MTDVNTKYLIAANNVKLENVFSCELNQFLNLIW